MARHESCHRWVLASVSLVMLGGCAFNSKPVSDFGKATAALTESYRPILKRPAVLCEESVLLKHALADVQFDAQALTKSDATIQLCRQLRDEQSTRAVVADAVSAYGKNLALLAGADAGALTADIESVAAKAKALKDRGGTASFDGDRIDALSKLVTVVVSMVRGQQAKSLTREVIAEAQAPLDRLVTEMTVWTDGTVIPRLTTSIEQRELALVSGLVVASDRSAVPGAMAMPGVTYTTRIAQFALLKEIAALRAEKKSAEAFGNAAKSLLEAHRGLGAAINEVSTEAQVKALKSFVDQVREVRDSADAL